MPYQIYCLANNFSHSFDCLYHLLIVSFLYEKAFFSLMCNLNCLVFLLLPLPENTDQKNYIVKTDVKDYTAPVSSGEFYASVPTFISLI